MSNVIRGKQAVTIVSVRIAVDSGDGDDTEGWVADTVSAILSENNAVLDWKWGKTGCDITAPPNGFVEGAVFLAPQALDNEFVPEFNVNRKGQLVFVDNRIPGPGILWTLLEDGWRSSINIELGDVLHSTYHTKSTKLPTNNDLFLEDTADIYMDWFKSSAYNLVEMVSVTYNEGQQKTIPITEFNLFYANGNESDAVAQVFCKETGLPHKSINDWEWVTEEVG